MTLFVFSIIRVMARVTLSAHLTGKSLSLLNRKAMMSRVSMASSESEDFLADQITPTKQSFLLDSPPPTIRTASLITPPILICTIERCIWERAIRAHTATRP